MKKLGEILEKLPDSSQLKRRFGTYADNHYLEQSVGMKASEFAENERSAIHWVSTVAVDRGKEIMVPEGIDRKQFEEFRTVFWSHDYEVPIGTNLWMKKKSENGRAGLIAKTRFANDAFSDTVYEWVKDDIIRGTSVGYIVTEGFPKSDKRFSDELTRLKQKYPDVKFGDAEFLISKSILLEYSLVGVPMNQEATMIAVSKGLTLDDLREKGVQIEDEKDAQIKTDLPWLASTPDGTWTISGSFTPEGKIKDFWWTATGKTEMPPKSSALIRIVKSAKREEPKRIISIVGRQKTIGDYVDEEIKRRQGIF